MASRRNSRSGGGDTGDGIGDGRLARVVAASPPAKATVNDDWPMFQHDAIHSGISPDTTWGASTASGLTMKWQQNVSGSAAVIASPIVAYNASLGKTIVYGASASGTVQAFDASTGTGIWTQSAGAGVIATPALDGNSLYIGTNGGTLIALNATTGAVQCSFALPIFPPETIPGHIQSSPVVGHIDSTGPIVFFGDIGQRERVNAGHEWAITGFGNSAGNCKLKWMFNGWANKGTNGSKTGSWSSPALAQDSTGRWLLVMGSSNPDQAVYALAAATGTEVWRFQTLKVGGDEDVGAGPTISAPGVNGLADGAVYIDGKNKIEYGLDLLTGVQMWSFNMLADAGLKTNSVSTAALVGNNVVVGYSGYVYDFNATTGAKVWRTATAVGTILASPSVSGAAGDQIAFIGDLSGGFHGYRLSDGALVYSLTIGAKMLASAAVSDAHVYIAAKNGVLYALG